MSDPSQLAPDYVRWLEAEVPRLRAALADVRRERDALPEQIAAAIEGPILDGTKRRAAHYIAATKRAARIARAAGLSTGAATDEEATSE